MNEIIELATITIEETEETFYFKPNVKEEELTPFGE